MCHWFINVSTNWPMNSLTLCLLNTPIGTPSWVGYKNGRPSRWNLHIHRKRSSSHHTFQTHSTMSGRGKGGKGLGKGGAKRHRKVLRDNIQGQSPVHFSLVQSFISRRSRYHKTRYSSSRTSRWCQTYLWFDLWRSSWCPEDLSWKRYSWRCDIHRTRQA